MDPVIIAAIVSAVGALAGVPVAYFAWRDHKRKEAEAEEKRRLQGSRRVIDVSGAVEFLEPAGPRPRTDSGSDVRPLRLSAPQDQNCLRQYLSALKESTAHIEMRGFGSEADIGLKRLQVPIKDLFTPLYIHRSAEVQLTKQSQRVSLLDAIQGYQRVLVFGEPGSGKSTVLRYIAHDSSDEILKRWEAEGAGYGSVYAGSTCIPLLLTATDLQRSLSSANRSSGAGPEDAILSYAAEDYAAPDARLGLFQAFYQLAQDGKLIVLLDGLDELPSRDAIGQVESAVRAFTRQFPNARMIATSRLGFSRSGSVWTSFNEIEIGGFSEPDIRDFVFRWTSSMLGQLGSAQREQHAHSLLSGITQSLHLLQMATNPVMLTCMAFLHYHRKALPESRSEALDAILQWLIKSRDNDQSGSSRQGSLRAKAFERLADEMSNASTGRRNVIGIGAAAQALAPLFGGDNNTALQFLNRERVRSGVIVPATQGDIKFWHLWFQEYLTAQATASHTDDETGWWGCVAPHLDDPAWKEIISFVPACLFRLGTERVVGRSR